MVKPIRARDIYMLFHIRSLTSLTACESKTANFKLFKTIISSNTCIRILNSTKNILETKPGLCNLDIDGSIAAIF